MDSRATVSLILLAGGLGLRMGTSTPKQFLPLKNEPLALYSFHSLLASSLSFQEVVIVTPTLYRSLFQHPSYKILFADPGRERHLSLYSGFQVLSHKVDFILIHDAARPLVQKDDVKQLFEAAKEVGAATLATPVTSTIKEGSETDLVIKTLNRKTLWDIQTPQCLKSSLVEEGFKRVFQENLTLTDDVSLAEILCHPVKLVTGSPKNFKVTHPIDLHLAELLLHE
ncbi:MAG: 2-C-methyl-D-erythritol 4-phosphate cytidylyltransferase [Chlamydiae bacterium]|nr:2-C-methyl-D-erythritol 4-phosphate cytidylyltransferase [Chlamydiota bacterium]